MYDRFVQLLQEKGITAYKISKDTGINQTTFADWKSKKSAPKIDKLQKIADYFNVSLDWLTGASDNRAVAKFTEGDNNTVYSPDPKIKIIARHLEEIPEEDRQLVIKNIENTIDIYLKAKGYKKEGE